MNQHDPFDGEIIDDEPVKIPVNDKRRFTEEGIRDDIREETPATPQKSPREIELDESARDLLVQEGYDPVYGARPLKRAIQTLIQNPLAVSLLKGEVASGQTVRVSAENGEMKFSPATAGQKAVTSP